MREDLKKSLQELIVKIDEREQIDGIAIVLFSDKGKHNVPPRLNLTMLGNMTYSRIFSAITQDTIDKLQSEKIVD